MEAKQRQEEKKTGIEDEKRIWKQRKLEGETRRESGSKGKKRRKKTRSEDKKRS